MSKDHVGSYEQSCIDYAMFGDPMRDAYEYEENARYDRWDGYRDEADLLRRQAEFEASDEYAEFCAEQDRQDRDDWEGSFDAVDNAVHAAWLDCGGCHADAA